MIKFLLLNFFLKKKIEKLIIGVYMGYSTKKKVKIKMHREVKWVYVGINCWGHVIYCGGIACDLIL